MGIYWLYLLIAGIFEIIWAVALKYCNGLSKIFPLIITIIAMAGSIFFLYMSLKKIPLGIAYSVWTGIGAIGTVILGIVLFDESKALIKIICILLILTGIVGLKLFSNKV